MRVYKGTYIEGLSYIDTGIDIAMGLWWYNSCIEGIYVKLYQNETISAKEGVYTVLFWYSKCAIFIVPYIYAYLG